jgi:hypothetical protein
MSPQLTSRRGSTTLSLTNPPEDLLGRIEVNIQLAEDQPTQPRPRRTIKPTLKVRENAAVVMYAALNAATANPLDAAITDPTFQ